jgi:hypothetical protein
MSASKPKPTDITFLIGTCEGGHRLEMRLEGENVQTSKTPLQEMVKLGVLCPHCKRKIVSATFERRKVS